MTRPRIFLCPNGFRLDSPASSDISWTDVRRIRSYKYDLFSYDEVCLYFELMDGRTFEVSEEFDAFSAVKEAMEKALPGINLKWWEQPAFPAFAECETIVFEQSKP
jgi:hypothetical protein